MKTRIFLSCILLFTCSVHANDSYFDKKYTDALSSNEKLELKYGEKCRTEIKKDKYLSDFDLCMGTISSDPNAYSINRWIRQTELSVLKEYARLEKLPNVTIGMTELDVIKKSRWGIPDRITTIKNATGTISKFFYRNNSLTFVNGILTEIQTSL